MPIKRSNSGSDSHGRPHLPPQHLDDPVNAGYSRPVPDLKKQTLEELNRASVSLKEIVSGITPDMVEASFQRRITELQTARKELSRVLSVSTTIDEDAERLPVLSSELVALAESSRGDDEPPEGQGRGGPEANRSDRSRTGGTSELNRRQRLRVRPATASHDVPSGR